MKKNIIVTIITVASVLAGNICTNLAIAKKAGYKWNKETKQMEKVCPFGIDLETEDQIAKSNMVWTIIGFVVGLVVRKTIEK